MIDPGLDEETLFSCWLQEGPRAPVQFDQLDSGIYMRVDDPRLQLEAAARLERAAQRLERAAAATRLTPAPNAALLTLPEVGFSVALLGRQVRRLISLRRAIGRGRSIRLASGASRKQPNC
jgi:hypothetical protein